MTHRKSIRCNLGWKLTQVHERTDLLVGACGAYPYNNGQYTIVPYHISCAMLDNILLCHRGVFLRWKFAETVFSRTAFVWWPRIQLMVQVWEYLLPEPKRLYRARALVQIVLFLSFVLGCLYVFDLEQSWRHFVVICNRGYYPFQAINHVAFILSFWQFLQKTNLKANDKPSASENGRLARSQRRPGRSWLDIRMAKVPDPPTQR